MQIMKVIFMLTISASLPPREKTVRLKFAYLSLNCEEN